MSHNSAQKFALLSVYDKSGLVELAKKVVERFTILSSGGTARVLREAGIDVTSVEDYTGSPEVLGGRVKTLHPRIHAGILSRPTQEHRSQLYEQGIGEIDLVVCNLYPFEATVASGASHAEIIENIDIGGPTLLRAAAKNHERVTVVTDPNDYPDVLDRMDDPEYRRVLAAKAFARVTSYDLAISRYFGGADGLFGVRTMELRYGENPHQSASVYGDLFFEQLSGKEVSYNNILDVKEGLALVRDFEKPACSVIKHRTPCGVGTADSTAEAYTRALVGDRLSAFGGVYCFNREIDIETAELLSQMFVDVLIAPDFSPEALEILGKKKTVILRAKDVPQLERDLHEIPGGFVIQDRDVHLLDEGDYTVVSDTKPDESTLSELLFAWTVVKHSRSNAIVVSKGTTALGIGSGQTSRIDAAKQAIQKAGDEVQGAVMASDAFFPFRDTVDLAAEVGIKAVIVPSGSIRDQESVDAANEHGMILVHTSYRSFKH